jgi:hypothetical protein
MRTIIYMLCAGIAFMLFTDPRNSQSTASYTPKDADAAMRDAQLATLIKQSSEIDSKLTDKVGQIIEGLNAVGEVNAVQLERIKTIEHRLVSVESKQSEAVKAEVSDVCDCGDCNERLTKLEAEMKELKSRPMYPAVSSSSGYGSTGTPVTSSGSTGSPVVSYGGSTGGPVVNQRSTPVRNVVSNVVNRLPSAPPAGSGHWTHDNEPIDFHLQTDHGINTSGMSLESMWSLHDSVHKGKVSRPPMRSAVRSNDCPGGVCPTGTNARSVSSTGWFLGKNLGFRR